MSFDPQQWLEAINAYHRAQGEAKASVPASTPVECKERHCFGCGATYLATHMVWDRFPDPANPYALCPKCRCAHEKSASAVAFVGIEYRHLFREFRDGRQELARQMARRN